MIGRDHQEDRPGIRVDGELGRGGDGREESRRCGSSMMVAWTPRERACSATTKRNSELVTIIGGANRPSRVTRSSTCWKVEDVPISGTNCFGIFSRDTGHSRVPAPPHKITGTTS
jgi:hypothetical protein